MAGQKFDTSFIDSSPALQSRRIEARDFKLSDIACILNTSLRPSSQPGLPIYIAQVALSFTLCPFFAATDSDG